MATKTPVDALERRKRASEEAAVWWVRLHAEEPSRGEREEFVDWLRESALHVAEMLRLAALHGGLQSFRSWPQVSTDGTDDATDDEDANVVTLKSTDNQPASTKRSPEGSPGPGEARK
jgi:ferric-dicitrate binding protein FerR (iron transport regulator)